MQQQRTFWRNNSMDIMALILGPMLVLSLIVTAFAIAAPPLNLRASSSATPAPRDAPCCCAPSPAQNGAGLGIDVGQTTPATSSAPSAP